MTDDATAIPCPDPVAVDPKSRRLIELARRVAATDCTVLVTGESGTGKEVLARFIHRQSPRADKPFVVVSCAAISESMLGGVLFAYERGAFTGAHAAHAGKFEQAQGGTLLLDEITEMPLGRQAKLLRVRQEREVDRIDGRVPMPLDVGVLATSDRRLAEEVRDSRFREDLYYRRAVIPLDIALVREPGDASQRALSLCNGPLVEREHVQFDPPGLRRSASTTPAFAAPVASAIIVDERCDDGRSTLARRRDRAERETLHAALHDQVRSRNAIALRLGISPRTVRYKLARLRAAGIEAPAA